MREQTTTIVSQGLLGYYTQTLYHTWFNTSPDRVVDTRKRRLEKRDSRAKIREKIREQRFENRASRIEIRQQRFECRDSRIGQMVRGQTLDLRKQNLEKQNRQQNMPSALLHLLRRFNHKKMQQLLYHRQFVLPFPHQQQLLLLRTRVDPRIDDSKKYLTLTFSSSIPEKRGCKN